MNKLLLVLVCYVLTTLSACKTSKILGYQTDTLKITEISKDVFLHESYLKYEGEKVGCNGLVYRINGHIYVIDTPTDEPSSKELLTWIDEHLEGEIKGVIVGHFHDDCLAGINYFHERGVPSYANEITIPLAIAEENQVPNSGFKGSLLLEDGLIEVFYPGEGHTKDNVVTYLKNEKVLFGGCLVKTLEASKGYLGDANVTAWPATIRKVKSRFASAKVIVPGHGDLGDASLLDYTEKLFSETHE